MIKFRCHHCNKKIGVEEWYVGRRVWCPRCRVLTVVPQPDPCQEDQREDNEKTIYSVYVCHSEPKNNDDQQNEVIDLFS